MKTAVTISLVKEAVGGPFIFWDDLAFGVRCAAEIGFDAVEIFAPSAERFDVGLLESLLSKHGLKVAAFGTGAGWLLHAFSLTDPSESRRALAIDFICKFVDLAARFEAPVIIGSMQGRTANFIQKKEALAWLATGLRTISSAAAKHGQPVLYEPLNRYETNLHNQLIPCADWLDENRLEGVKILADLFHMNIEESNLSESLSGAMRRIGHVHFVDSNRRAAGLGHTVFEPVIQTLRDGKYEGYLSAEAFALPDSMTAAETTMRALRGLI